MLGIYSLPPRSSQPGEGADINHITKQNVYLKSKISVIKERSMYHKSHNREVQLGSWEASNQHLFGLT